MKFSFLIFSCLILLAFCKNPIQDGPNFLPGENPSLMDPSKAIDLDYYTGRLGWQKPNLVISKLGNLEGKTVADIGAGVGFFAFRLSEKAEKVIAIDIDPRIIEILEVFKMNLSPQKRMKFEARLVSSGNPQLKENEVDAVIIVNTLGFIENRASYIEKLRSAIKPGGVILINDFKLKKMPEDIDAPEFKYRVPVYQVENILSDAGFSKIVSDDTSLDFQYIVTAVNEK